MEDTMKFTHRWNVGLRLFGYPMPVFSLTAIRIENSTQLSLTISVWKLAMSVSLMNYA
jgi:hypothetical protein